MGQEREVVFKIVVNEKGDIVRVEPGEGEKVVEERRPLNERPIEVRSLQSLHVMVGPSPYGGLMACGHVGCIAV
jgi:hypothetical protein